MAALLMTAPASSRGATVASGDDASQGAQYDAAVPKTVIELQRFRRVTSIRSGAAVIALTDLNPQIHAWFLLTLQPAVAGESRSYHLENPQPQTQSVTLDPGFPDGVRLTVAGHALDCTLWPKGQPAELERARQSSLPDAPLCDGRLYLRNAVKGTYTNIERITNVLRDHVWGGDKIVGFIKDDFFKDAFIERGTVGTSIPAAMSGSTDQASTPNLPRPAAVDGGATTHTMRPENLAIAVEADTKGLMMGRWYGVRDAPGVFVSVIEPGAVAPDLLRSYKTSVNTLDAVEAGALDYLVALDLSQFDLGFALGTDHPRVDWSPRVLDKMRNPRLPGPDGIGGVTPLIVNGIVNPSLVARTAAAFAGGFKREHGAFRYGPLALQNSGTHYGFIEQGVVFSKLQPGLATLMVMDTGAVEMKTWVQSDDALLAQVKFARQNGVPLIEFDAATRASRPGPWVNQWGPGNWSGSSEEVLRTLRAGACLQETAATRYLIFGYFSTATPSAMARVFQAYGCRYAMHLDMNALEHTYFALYTHKNAQVSVQHLIAGMSEVDRKGGDRLAPRFLSFPDDRDFFYLLRKE